MPSINQLADICIPMVDEPAYSARKLRIVTIGAGFSGLVLAHKIQHEFPELQDFIDHTIFELQDDVGADLDVVAARQLGARRSLVTVLSAGAAGTREAELHLGQRENDRTGATAA